MAGTHRRTDVGQDGDDIALHERDSLLGLAEHLDLGCDPIVRRVDQMVPELTVHKDRIES